MSVLMFFWDKILLQDIMQCENQWGQLGRDRQFDLVMVALTWICSYPCNGITQWDFETSIETSIFAHGWKLWYHVEVLATSSAMEPLSYGCVYPFCFFLSMCTRMHVHVWDTIHIPANGYTLLVPLIYRWQYNV